MCFKWHVVLKKSSTDSTGPANAVMSELESPHEGSSTHSCIWNPRNIVEEEKSRLCPLPLQIARVLQKLVSGGKRRNRYLFIFTGMVMIETDVVVLMFFLARLEWFSETRGKKYPSDWYVYLILTLTECIVSG